ncbi:putative NADPH dehydrogenase C23G7.10c [Hypsizygus marmoreus]|uniref:NADPH dehydrogenase C23G7.10c n=1 Tax=Hypsizygus marmoreus TaxID=39966 RepID=A0A369K7Q8_HYPMA|nr:putative NADPH dehydrogenase C23G7.10c [Hypsizygus marmoreus]
MSPNINHSVPGAYQYFPLNEPAVGNSLTLDENTPFLFRPLILRGMEFKNRIFVSPMCQYSSDNGHATDWHLVHIGGFATRGVGAICMEATSVVPEGRISPEDAGLWTDTQIEPLRRIVNFCHAQGTKIGIQLAHAGRKASTHAPWVQLKAGKGAPHTASEDENGWPDSVYGPSNKPFSDTYPIPKAMSEQDMKKLQDAFISAIQRCKKAGFDFIELHAAHGYLLHSFVSPLSNDRNDEFGGQLLENRLRFPLRLMKSCREAWPDKPLFVRISASDWAEGPEKDGLGVWLQWGIEQSIIFAEELQKLGVDLIDCSSGGNWVKQKIPVKHGYQVHFAEALKQALPTLPVGTVGMITEPLEAESYLKSGKADVIFLARELIRTPHWPLFAAQKLGVAVRAANQYLRGW